MNTTAVAIGVMVGFVSGAFAVVTVTGIGEFIEIDDAHHTDLHGYDAHWNDPGLNCLYEKKWAAEERAAMLEAQLDVLNGNYARRVAIEEAEVRSGLVQPMVDGGKTYP